MFSFENGLSFIMFVGNKLVLKLEVADEPNHAVALSHKAEKTALHPLPRKLSIEPCSCV